MSKRSSIISHTNRLDMERLYLKGNSIASIARDFDVSEDALRNHCQNHLSRQLVQAYTKKELAGSMDLLGEIDNIIIKAKDIFQRNYEKGHDTTALKALGEQRSTLELLCKISAYMHQTKLLELQEQQNTDRQQEADDLAERIKILTDAELEMLEKIQRKIETQDKDMIILSDQKAMGELPSFVPEVKDIPVRKDNVNQVALNQNKTKIELNPVEEEENDWDWQPEPDEKVNWINDRPIKRRD